MLFVKCQNFKFDLWERFLAPARATRAATQTLAAANPPSSSPSLEGAAGSPLTSEYKGTQQDWPD